MGRWASSAFSRLQNTAVQAAEQAQQGFQRAQTMDWQEQAESVRGGLSRNFSQGLDSVARVTTSASSAVQHQVAQGVESARTADWQDQLQGVQSGLSKGFEKVATGAQAATSTVRENATVAAGAVRENATAAAGASRQALSVAGGRVQGAAQLAMDPKKLMKFGGVFFLGILPV